LQVCDRVAAGAKERQVPDDGYFLHTYT